MENFYIFQHLGMGDFFICNSIVRKYVKDDPQRKYHLFCPPNYIKSLSQMYDDLKNLEYIGIQDGGDAWYGTLNFVNEHLQKNRVHPSKMLVIGWRYPQWIVNPQISFERNFYLHQNIPYEEKWNSFKCIRNEQKENELFDSLNIEGDYIFVHDDSRYRIDPNRLPNDMRIISASPEMSDCMIHYSKLIENAKEVHCIESSFGFMNDLMGLNKNFYIHRYARTHKIPHFDIPDCYKYAKEILV